LIIQRFSLIEGAKKATGLAVVIDVFRAFTTAAYIFGNGADRIYPVASLEKAFRLKEEYPEWILIGEREGKKVEGFDFGNSPYEVSKVDFSGNTIIQTTSAGTQGLMAAMHSEEVLPGSFVMADAIIEYIKTKNPESVSLVAMGRGGRRRSVEDELFADYIEQVINGKKPDFQAMKHVIRENPAGEKFFDQNQPQFVEEDFHCAMDIDRFDFCLRLEKGDLPYMVKVNR
jgi:2-phosphosulfolactate phosphatase